ncbi:MAG TPA: nucleotide exchange factor GrpE [Actinomycetota bacterium]|nr:nucleotide exchange factor GrpE [Actinomycetota bacterium]
MTEKDRVGRDERHPRHEGEERPRVKVTDRRRVHADEGAPAAGAAGAPGTPTEGEAFVATGPASAQAEDARREIAELRDHLQRLQAEYANYRKRVLREQTQAIEMASEPLVRKLLEVLDDFELALMAAEQKPDFEKFHRGVELVYAKLVDTLRSEGVDRIDAEGKPFDPEEHEALMGTTGSDREPVVTDVFRQGYKLRGRVIRPAGVRVGQPHGPSDESSDDS